MVMMVTADVIVLNHFASKYREKSSNNNIIANLCVKRKPRTSGREDLSMMKSAYSFEAAILTFFENILISFHFFIIFVSNQNTLFQ